LPCYEICVIVIKTKLTIDEEENLFGHSIRAFAGLGDSSNATQSHHILV
jgi:hypothetical protein